jgi:hypothetical protein
MVTESRSMLAKINFPREALILAGIGLVLFNFAIRAVLLVAVMVWYQVPPTAGLLLVPLDVLALIGLGTMIGVLLTPLGILYQDVGRKRPPTRAFQQTLSAASGLLHAHFSKPYRPQAASYSAPANRRECATMSP